MKHKIKSILLPAIALGMTAATGQAATVFSDVAVIVNDGFVNTTDSGSVSRDGTGKFYRTLVTFNIQDIITSESLINSVTDFTNPNYTFNFSFNTTNTVTLGAGTYKVEYVGFFANGTFPTTGTGSTVGAVGTWAGKYTTPTVASVNTGVADTTATQTGITATGFNLNNVTEGNSATDRVMFRIHYSDAMTTNNLFQSLGGYTLSAIPEPSTALLGGLGLLALLRRRR